MNMKLHCRQMEALLGIMHVELAETTQKGERSREPGPDFQQH